MMRKTFPVLFLLVALNASGIGLLYLLQKPQPVQAAVKLAWIPAVKRTAVQMVQPEKQAVKTIRFKAPVKEQIQETKVLPAVPSPSVLLPEKKEMLADSQAFSKENFVPFAPVLTPLFVLHTFSPVVS